MPTRLVCVCIAFLFFFPLRAADAYSRKVLQRARVFQGTAAARKAAADARKAVAEASSSEAGSEPESEPAAVTGFKYTASQVACMTPAMRRAAYEMIFGGAAASDMSDVDVNKKLMGF